METAIKPDQWNCPHIIIKWHASSKDFELEELCKVRNYSECLLVNGDRCEIYERWIKENG